MKLSNCKKLLRNFIVFFFKTKSFKSDVYITLIWHTSICTSLFQVLSSHIFMVSGYHSDSATLVFMAWEHLPKHYHKHEIYLKSLVLLSKKHMYIGVQ